MTPSVLLPRPGAVDLANCADEPIHIPGLIQPHGALLVFDRDARLTAWSDNAAAMLGLATAPALDVTPDALGLPAAVREQIDASIADIVDGAGMPIALEAELNGVRFDCIIHFHQNRLLAEFELRELPTDAVAAFALKAHTAIDRLKRQRGIPALLQLAAEAVRNITGFDRVVAYRFRQDDSGDVVAEALDAALPPFIGRRYPASDIPAQARRLYVINTLRLIADVGYAPVPLHGAPGAAPLDMSYSVLRSVSPIHIEYLQNMGVGASMSVSIVVNDRLWGLIACHHMGPKQVPYSIRMAIDVLAQVLASTVQSLEARAHATLIELAAQVRTQVMETLLHDDDPLQALARHGPALCDSLNADALIIGHHGKRLTHGDVETGAAVAIAGAINTALDHSGGQLVEFNRLADWPEAARPLLGRWAGALALHFDPANGGWLVALRPEQVEAIAWAGKPEKDYASGPLGPRLTPRGSFDEWREIVRGSAEPWEPVYRTIAGHLLSEMHRASVARQAETDRIRTELLAMLGHDLRDPLHSINMAAIVLEHGQGHAGAEQTLGRRIQASSNRMQRLIAQVLDLSRIQGGMGMGLTLAETDVVALVADIVDESRMAHPGVVYELSAPPALTAAIDADRMAQVLTNLLGNARHHGTPGQPVRIALETAAGRLRIVVSNVAEPIAETVAATLFNPFKRSSLHNERNRSGMGLGLYIAREIVLAHGGEIDYRAEPPLVLFTVELPLAPAAGPAR